MVNQKYFKNLGFKVTSIYNSGCYFLSLLYIGKVELTVEKIIDYYDEFVRLGYMDADCYIEEPDSIIKYLTGNDCKVENSFAYDNQARAVIAKYHNPRTGFNHFVVMKSDVEVEFDSLVDSVTVKEGYVHSFRNFYY